MSSFFCLLLTSSSLDRDSNPRPPDIQSGALPLHDQPNSCFRLSVGDAGAVHRSISGTDQTPETSSVLDASGEQRADGAERSGLRLQHTRVVQVGFSGSTKVQMSNGDCQTFLICRLMPCECRVPVIVCDDQPRVITHITQVYDSKYLNFRKKIELKTRFNGLDTQEII